MVNWAELGHLWQNSDTSVFFLIIANLRKQPEELLMNVTYYLKRTLSPHNLVLVHLSDDSCWSSEYNKVNLLITK